MSMATTDRPWSASGVILRDNPLVPLLAFLLLLID